MFILKHWHSFRAPLKGYSEVVWQSGNLTYRESIKILEFGEVWERLRG